MEAAVAANREGYQTAIYLLDLTKPGAEAKELTAGPRDSSPRWSPDGKQIAFVRSAEKEGKFGPAQVYVKLVGKRGESDTDYGYGEGRFVAGVWSPKGDAIAVSSLTAQDQDKAKSDAAMKARATGDDAHVSDVRIIDREVYRLNGEGYLDASLVPQIYLVYLPKADGTQASAWQLTGGRFGVEEFIWPATKGHADWIYYTSVHEEEPYYDAADHNSIYGIAVETSESHAKEMPAAAFTADLKVSARGLSLSHDGARLAFHAAAAIVPPEKPVSHAQSGFDDDGVRLAWLGSRVCMAN